MALILNIETSSTQCSVCLAENGQTIAEKTDMSENKHASLLTILVKETLSQAHLILNDLSAIAISSGPGSYTGLRIGTSVAKGLCYGLGVPLIAVPTLQGLAYRMAAQHPDSEGIYMPMIDARRNDVYMGIYDSNYIEIQSDSFETINNLFFEKLNVFKNRRVYIGELSYLKINKVCLNKDFGIVIENIIFEASNIKSLSYIRYAQGLYEDTAYFEPYYLKEFEGLMKI